MKRTLRILLSVLLVLIPMLSACGTAAPTQQPQATAAPTTASTATEQPAESDVVTPAGELPIVKEKITLTAFNFDQGGVPRQDRNATKFIEEKTNIHLEWKLVPDADWVNQRNLMIQSGDYPDIFLHGFFTSLDVMRYGVDEKIFLPLNGYIEKYAHFFNRVTTDFPNKLADITAPDGNIYGLPSVDIFYPNNVFEKMQINTKWLEEQKLEMPKTTEELYNVLKVFKEKYNSVGVTGANNTWAAEPQYWLMNPFILSSQPNFFVFDGDAIRFAPVQDAWKEGLKYANKLYAEGLIDKAAFTQGVDEMQKLIADESGFRVAMYAGGNTGVGIDINNDRLFRAYGILPPVKGPGGKGAAFWRESTNIDPACFVITNKCKAPEAAFRFADYLYSEEGSLLNMRGVEGYEWKKADAGAIGINGEPALYTAIPVPEGQTRDDMRMYAPPIYYSEKMNMGWSVVSDDIYDPANILLREYKNAKTYDGEFRVDDKLGNVFFPVDKATELAQLKTNIDTYVKRCWVEFITGAKNIDADWDAYVKGFDGLKLNEYVDAYQQAYNKKIGK